MTISHSDVRKCTKCGDTKPIEEFYPNAKSLDGRMRRCKECVKKQIYGRKSRKEAQKKIDVGRKANQPRLKAIRESLPEDRTRTFRRNDFQVKRIWTPEDLDHVADLWAAVIDGARNGLNGGGNGNKYPPDPYFFIEKGGIFEWLKGHV